MEFYPLSNDRRKSLSLVADKPQPYIILYLLNTGNIRGLYDIVFDTFYEVSIDYSATYHDSKLITYKSA